MATGEISGLGRAHLRNHPERGRPVEHALDIERLAYVYVIRENVSVNGVPLLNPPEILWKHVKHFWRRFVVRNGADFLNKIQSLMRGFGSAFTINFG